jgi:hypothetical protein
MFRRFDTQQAVRCSAHLLRVTITKAANVESIFDTGFCGHKHLLTRFNNAVSINDVFVSWKPTMMKPVRRVLYFCPNSCLFYKNRRYSTSSCLSKYKYVYLQCMGYSCPMRQSENKPRKMEEMLYCRFAMLDSNFTTRWKSQFVCCVIFRVAVLKSSAFASCSVMSEGNGHSVTVTFRCLLNITDHLLAPFCWRKARDVDRMKIN